MANYIIEARRTIHYTGTFEIEADDEGEARAEAMDMLSDLPNDDERWDAAGESDDILSIEREKEEEEEATSNG